MSTLKNAGKPATNPRVASAKIEYLNCSLCGAKILFWESCPDCRSIFCKPCAEAGHYCEDLVPKKLPRILSQTSSTIKKTNYVSLHYFQSWDIVDQELTAWVVDDMPFVVSFDITGWAFADSDHWYEDLCCVPFGCLLKVRWEIGCKVEAVEAVEANYPQPELASTTATTSTTSTTSTYDCKKCNNPLAVDGIGKMYCPWCHPEVTHSYFGWCDDCATFLVKDALSHSIYCPHCQDVHEVQYLKISGGI